MTLYIICHYAHGLIRKAVKELFDEKEHNTKEIDIAASISWEDLPEDGYFGMYTHFSIHETMLKVHNMLTLTYYYHISLNTSRRYY